MKVQLIPETVRYREEAASQLLNLYPELVFCLDSSMVEHAAVNRGVAGSSPARGAERQQLICCLFVYWFMDQVMTINDHKQLFLFSNDLLIEILNLFSC